MARPIAATGSAKQFRDLLFSPASAVYREDGSYLGQSIPFRLTPALAQSSTHGFSSRCAERLARVDAHIVGEIASLLLKLAKRETFYAETCSDHVGEIGPIQEGTLRSSNNLAVAGGIAFVTVTLALAIAVSKQEDHPVCIGRAECVGARMVASRLQVEKLRAAEAERDAAKVRAPKDSRRCLPCAPVPVGGLAFEYHSKAAGNDPHDGMENHTHHFKRNQSPPRAGCKCFWIKPTENLSPLPGAVPVQPPPEEVSHHDVFLRRRGSGGR
jgi:hypothetical protein